MLGGQDDPIPPAALSMNQMPGCRDSSNRDDTGRPGCRTLRSIIGHHNQCLDRALLYVEVKLATSRLRGDIGGKTASDPTAAGKRDRELGDVVTRPTGCNCREPDEKGEHQDGCWPTEHRVTLPSEYAKRSHPCQTRRCNDVRMRRSGTTVTIGRSRRRDRRLRASSRMWASYPQGSRGAEDPPPRRRSVG